MDQYGPETYGERVADVYDDWYDLGDGRAEATLVEELANGGRVLELGIGTGRVALVLAAHGVDVHGIDASPAIVEKLRAKPGGDAIPVTIGDMADVPVDGKFAVIFIVFNTFFMLDTLEAQRRCLRNIRAHLAPGGCFVVHVFVPDMSRIEAGSHIAAREAGLNRVRIDTTIYDRLAQRLDTTQVRITEQGIKLVHAKLRYAPPTELDLMAELEGLKLEARYATYDKQPFTDESAFHVSVYRA